MPTPDPYLAHLHFCSSVFAAPNRFMIFHKLVTYGHLAQAEVDPLLTTFFGMVALPPKSVRLAEPLPDLTAEEKAKILELAKRQGVY